ncbi:MAG: winged helix-turn-helix domain-containing protein [Anaerolineales bacterium]|nr:winged helix-turn-helix domain-containing protein [Anaerolineales bacterium]
MTNKKWTFITNHAAVLTLLDREDHLTSREISTALGITERTVIRIIKDLEGEGYITKRKEGRENRYTINKDLPLRHNNQQEVFVRELLQLISHNN